jgi:hypothetical protein
MSTNRRWSTLGAVAAAVMLIAALSACGPGPDTDESSTPSGSAASPTPTVALDPEVLLDLAVDNLLDAPSKRLIGTAEVASATQEIEVAYIGDGAIGHKVERAAGVESATDFIRVDGSLYIRAGAAYWQWYVGLQDLNLVVDHWVRVPDDHPEHSKLLVLTDSATPWEPVGELVMHDTGGSTVVLEDSGGNRFTISTAGIPYLVRVEMTETSESGVATADIAFSDFGAVTDTITAPTGPIVDLQ